MSENSGKNYPGGWKYIQFTVKYEREKDKEAAAMRLKKKT